MKTEYTERCGFLQVDGVEHKQYAEAYSAEIQKAQERDGADLFEKVLNRDNLNKASQSQEESQRKAEKADFPKPRQKVRYRV